MRVRIREHLRSLECAARTNPVAEATRSLLGVEVLREWKCGSGGFPLSEVTPSARPGGLSMLGR